MTNTRLNDLNNTQIIVLMHRAAIVDCVFLMTEPSRKLEIVTECLMEPVILNPYLKLFRCSR